jgi:hypothetical protein
VLTLPEAALGTSVTDRAAGRLPLLAAVDYSMVSRIPGLAGRTGHGAVRAATSAACVRLAGSGMRWARCWAVAELAYLGAANWARNVAVRRVTPARRRSAVSDGTGVMASAAASTSPASR